MSAFSSDRTMSITALRLAASLASPAATSRRSPLDVASDRRAIRATLVVAEHVEVDRHAARARFAAMALTPRPAKRSLLTRLKPGHQRHERRLRLMVRCQLVDVGFGIVS